MTDVPHLRALLARPDLRLRLLSEPAALPAGWAERRIRWVHSSDLADPTPFLTEELVLLTTGTQFTGRRAADPDAYVAQLAARGVLALGFGTEVVRDGVPERLVAACRAAGMPLFEVPYRTPFIAIARANAEAVAAEAYARRSWALAAQRAIALAALRPDGLMATLAELARQLGAWVGLYEASGDLVRAFPAPLAAREAEGVADEVRGMLRRGGHASSVQVEGAPFTLQPLGTGTHVRGVIALGAGGLDQEARGVVTAVLALARLALEQGRGIRRAEAALRAGVVQALLAGEDTLARDLARERWGDLPPEPLHVAVAEVARTDRDAVAEWLDARALRIPGSFWGRGPEGLVVLLGAADPALPDDLAAAFDARCGVSAPTGYADLPQAHGQALAALRRSGEGATWFARIAASGLLPALGSDTARALARERIAPLQRHDDQHGTALRATVRAWLEHDARIDETAQAIGVHRHTVRARIALAERVLGRSLSSFPARAELWAALELAE